MTTFTRRNVLRLATALAAGPGPALAAEAFVEGRHYHMVGGNVPAPPPGTVSITEVFSYGCPGCNSFLPYMQALEKKCAAAGITVRYLHAGWIAAENWPALQRAHITAKVLGVDRKAHDALFAAVWKSGELAVIDARTRRPKKPLPSMTDIAAFYQRVTGVAVAKFLETAKSFSVDAQIRSTDNTIKGFRAGSTPTLVVNDRYRVDGETASTWSGMTEIAQWLAQRELGRRASG
jgi:thiol:disulfide interchange protein DsbA